MCLLQVFFVIQTRTLELTDFADFESRLVFVEVRLGLNDSLASLSFLVELIGSLFGTVRTELCVACEGGFDFLSFFLIADM